MEDFVSEIKNRMTTNFKVTKIQIGDLKEFKKVCKEEYGDVYAIGIKNLLKIKRQYEQLLRSFNNFQTQLDNLQRQIDELKKSKSKPEINTFGGKKNV